MLSIITSCDHEH